MDQSPCPTNTWRRWGSAVTSNHCNKLTYCDAAGATPCQSVSRPNKPGSPPRGPEGAPGSPHGPLGPLGPWGPGARGAARRRSRKARDDYAWSDFGRGFHARSWAGGVRRSRSRIRQNTLVLQWRVQDREEETKSLETKRAFVEVLLRILLEILVLASKKP